MRGESPGCDVNYNAVTINLCFDYIGTDAIMEKNPKDHLTATKANEMK